MCSQGIETGERSGRKSLRWWIRKAGSMGEKKENESRCYRNGENTRMVNEILKDHYLKKKPKLARKHKLKYSLKVILKLLCF